MNCDYCYCGKAQNVDMNREVVDRVLDQTASIDKLRFIGGEVTCNIPIMRYILDGLKQRNIKVCGIGIASNATIYSEELIKLYNDFYDYAIYQDIGYTHLEISTDEKHKSQPEYSVIKKNIPLYQEKFKGHTKLNASGDTQTIVIGKAATQEFREKYKDRFATTRLGENLLCNKVEFDKDRKVQSYIKINPFGFVFDNLTSYEIQDFNNSEYSIGNIFEHDFEEMFALHNEKKEVIAYEKIKDCINKLTYYHLNIDEFYSVLLPNYKILRDKFNGNNFFKLKIGELDGILSKATPLYEQVKHLIGTGNQPINDGELLWYYAEELQSIIKEKQKEKVEDIPKLIDAFIIIYDSMSMEGKKITQQHMRNACELFMECKGLKEDNKKKYSYLQSGELEYLLYAQIGFKISGLFDKIRFDEIKQNLEDLNTYRQKRQGIHQ